MQDDETNTNSEDKPYELSDSNQSNSTIYDVKSTSSLIDMSGILPIYSEFSPIASSDHSLVFTAVTKQSKKRVAVKKVSLQKTINPIVLRNLLREVTILRRMDHDNVVRVLNVVASSYSNPSNAASSENDKTFSFNSLESIYIEMELIDIDLRSILNQRTLSANYVKLFSYQLLRGLKYIHSANVIHRDLTPSNIFINIDTLMLKIGDFGVSCIYDPGYDRSNHLSFTTTNTCYQSPEMMICPGHYNQAVDMWAVGCIMAEMWTGQALFPGDHAVEHMQSISDSVSITKQDWDSLILIPCSENHCNIGVAMPLLSNEGKPTHDLRERFKSIIDVDSLDLLVHILSFDPRKRMTSQEALAHRAFDDLSCIYDEPTCHQAFYIEDELESPQPITEQLKSSADHQVNIHTSRSGVCEPVTSYEIMTSSSTTTATSGRNQNLLEMLRSDPSINPISCHDDLSESEARTMACDFDYGVQVLLMTSSSRACCIITAFDRSLTDQ